MKQIFVVLTLSLTLDDGHLKDWEGMYTQLEEEVDFELGSFICRPIGIVLIDFGTFSTPSNNWRKPVLITEEQEGNNGSKRVEETVIAELEYIYSFPISHLPFILRMDHLVYLVTHHVTVPVFCYLCLYIFFTQKKVNPTAIQMSESIENT